MQTTLIVIACTLGSWSTRSSVNHILLVVLERNNSILTFPELEVQRDIFLFIKTKNNNKFITI